MPLTARQRSIHSKNGTKRVPSFSKGKRPRKGSEGIVEVFITGVTFITLEYLVTNAPTDLKSISYPGGAVALLLLLTARLASSYWGHISDCDETYNYWEPLHYLVYGNGLQTWEYSPLYAIRSYMPLWLFAIPAKVLAYFLHPLGVFYSIRSLLAILTAVTDLMFYKAVCHEFGVNVGRIWLALTIISPGMFASASAMLPSSWGGALASAAAACWWRKRYPSAIVFTAANVLLGWPFTALLGLPIAMDMLIMKLRITEFIKWSLISLIFILLPTILVDSIHYGRLVVAPWNIVAYNIFTEHGPDLYGVEPWTYYFVNGFLNFNFVWVLCLQCPLLLFLCSVMTSNSAPRASFCSPYWLSLQPVYTWLLVFMLQPHKEERFLYPIYSMIALTGAISLDCLLKMTFSISSMIFSRRQERHYLVSTEHLIYLFVSLSALVGISRTVSLYNNYHGPMTLLRHLPEAESHPFYVCFGKDWYRSPSSFHLHEGYEIRIIKSEFDGQLPAPYDDGPDATRIIHPYFNDLNKEDNRTYLHPSKCHLLVDSDIGTPTHLQPHYHKQTNIWDILTSVPIIDAEKSHQIFRAFYIPILSAKTNVYANLYLLKNKLVGA